MDMWFIAGIPVVEENHGLIVSSFFFTVLAVAIVVLRVLTRSSLLKSTGIEDYFMILAMVCPSCIMIIKVPVYQSFGERNPVAVSPA